MIFVEPQQSYATRMLGQQRRRDEELLKRRTGHLHPIAEEILYIVSQHDDPEIPRTTIVNRFSKRMGAHGRKDRHEWRMKAFLYISSLLKMGKLEWGDKRNHVRIAPPERHLEFLARIDRNCASLPPPNI